MRIAVTADLHLREANPERLGNLEILLQQLVSERIHHLIIAGDLFDGTDGSYAQFDSLALRSTDIQFLLIPGNHDPDLRQDLFAAGNVQVLTKPTLKRLDGRVFLFLPYREGTTMGETISGLPEVERLRTYSWVLVSHGDFAAPRRRENGEERGYFPLTREDLVRYRPVRVILGHIHNPNSTAGEVVYPGSPYPISAAEYGQRRLLILESESATVSEFPLTHPPVQVRAEIYLIPDGREEEQIRRLLKSVLAAQNSSENLLVQVVLKGYSASRRKAQRFAQSFLSEAGIACSGIDLESLKVNDQESLATLAETVRQRITALELKYEEAEELRQAVLGKALEIVYGD
jgi:DNA repair exonuclease SbcCD nuclease subunit